MLAIYLKYINIYKTPCFRFCNSRLRQSHVASHLDLSNSSSTRTLALSPRFKIVFISLAATVQKSFASSKAGIIMPPWNSSHARPRILGKDTNLVSVSCKFFFKICICKTIILKDIVKGNYFQ